MDGPNVRTMSPASIWLRRIAIVIGVALLAGATVALGAFADLGTWVIAVIGGGALGALATAVALGLSGASSGALAPHYAATIDPVTGLPSVEKLQADLEAAMAQPTPAPHWLYVFALEGLKRYDDAYGEEAGDALLTWLSRRLRDAVDRRGAIYRMRGGAFALLTPGPERMASRVRVDASTALFEVGDGFMVWSVVGEAAIPEQTDDPLEAVELADRRSRSQRVAPDAGSQLDFPGDPFADVTLDRSQSEVGRLARAVGTRLGLTAPELDVLEAAAQLRDVGNVAIPSSAFVNPGTLPGQEWEFIRLHTVVGERLLDGRFGLPEVAPVVRWSHERWDGAGYPDGLRGAEIPLSARITFVCSAFEDMRAERAHRPALSEQAALAELRRNAGTQFDPGVVAAFGEAVPVEHEPLRLTG
jgi:two-component system, cell cycle response regulator